MSATQRYVPQSPTPHSPPKTPDESHSGRAQETIATVTPFINVLDTHPKLSVSPDNDSPSSTPGAVTPITPGRPRTESILSGMGINFPADANPLPAGLDGNDDHDPAISSLPSDGRKEGAVHVEQLLAADMTRTLSDPISTTAASVPMGTSKSSAGGMKYPLPRAVSRDNKQLLPSDPSTIIPDSPGRSAISAKSRATSPRVPSTSTFPSSNGFASSSSFYANPTGSEHRERVVSPSRPTFFDSGSNENLPSIKTTSTFNALLDEKPPIYSPAIDGKKEPSIKGNPYGTSDLYDPSLYAHPNAQNSSIQARNRSPYPSSLSHNEKAGAYGVHPLTSQSYNHPTTNEALNKVPFKDSVGYWLGMYFFFNLGLTLFNKVVLVSFPFPYTLTGLHALSGCAGCYFALERGAFVPARLTQKENLVLAAFSVLYTINIAVSNISLQLVTVPFHQVVRASTPLFTILIATVILRQKFSFMKLVSLLPVIAGVGFATYGDYYFTAWGLFLTLLGTFLAALKTVVTNLIQTGGGGRLKLHPLDLLMRMSPLAFIQCVAYGWYTGELERVRVYGATQMTRSKAIALLVNGVIACGLNIVSFTANKKAGALTMTVSANCKQVLTIALAVVLFDLHISPTNGIGILLTLIGGGWYGYVEFMEKRQKTVKLVDRS